MSKSKKKREETNPEILLEREKKNTLDYYDDDFEYRLFPGFLDGSTASATESTGLIQVGPITPAVLDAYDNVYSYRKNKEDSDSKTE